MAPRKPDPKSLEGRLRAMALSYPDTTEDFPWGERAIKVKGKAFLFMRAEGGTVSFSVKLPVSGAEALEESFTEPTHYGLGKHGWVTATVTEAVLLRLPAAKFTSLAAVYPPVLAHLAETADEMPPASLLPR